MRYVYLYNIKINKIVPIEASLAIEHLYFLEYKVPSIKNIEEHISNTSDVNDKVSIYMTNYEDYDQAVQKIKTMISKYTKYMPLYNIRDNNITLYTKEQVHDKVTQDDYRFADHQLILELRGEKKKFEDLIENNSSILDDALQRRNYNKMNMMLDFLDQLDIGTLHEVYNSFYYSLEIQEINTCIRPSFDKRFQHISPYYGYNEILSLALIMGIIKSENDPFDFDKICKAVSENDVTSTILISHQDYIIENKKLGLLHYYTMNGSYYANKYLRNQVSYIYKNDYLENIILDMWQLIKDAPAFDKSYILYRFVDDDSFIRHLSIGDIYTEKGFLSTTRAPFYRSDLYSFGCILMKIKIPNKIKGIALSVESFSMFSSEEEIVFPPNTNLRLISRDQKCIYRHPNAKHNAEITTRYEFVWESNENISLIERPIYDKTLTVDFLKLENFETITISEKIRKFEAECVNPMHYFKYKMGNETFGIFTEWYDSTGAYADLYGIRTKNSYSLYTLKNGNILFMIELGEVNAERKMIVNYMRRNNTEIENIYDNPKFIEFLASVAYYFRVPNVILYANYTRCRKNIILGGGSCSLKKRKNSTCKNPIYNEMVCGNSIGVTKYIDTQRGFSGIKITDPNKKSIIDTEYGIYCYDFYHYLDENKKRFFENVSNDEIKPQFSYFELDKLKSTKITDYIFKTDGEVWQVYDKLYKGKNPDDIHTFYLWCIKNNRCQVIKSLTNIMSRIYPDNNDNPFLNDYYILNTYTYLYNRKLISSYPKFYFMDDKPVDNKNMYRNE